MQKGRAMMILGNDSYTELRDANPFYYVDGRKTWNFVSGDSYRVTGVDARGKRFRIDTNSVSHMSGINVYRGSKWLVRMGRRWLINRIYN